ncbi:MAG: hypothetical protein ACD_84C00043G0006 [uncultured bacterium]|nr:MAG: hypothetical protein ACD_84C00043G0006 [uncultured bacterium]
MAIAVSYGSDAEFNALCYGANKHPSTLQYLENQVSNVSRTLTDAGRSFFSNARQLYDQLNNSEAMRLARAALNKAGSLFQSDRIRDIWDLAEIQNAPLTMQRWIMAQVDVRAAFHEQRCDGYSDTYVDNSPEDIGETHYDYRRVMHGMVMEDPEGDDKTTFYLDELHEGDRELALDEKISILNTWDVVAELMQYGEFDPTSVWNNKL